MSAIQKEALGYVREIPDSSLKAIMPLLSMLVNDIPVIEVDLTESEKAIIREGREEYKKGKFIRLEDAI
jgi:hypothetical protein